MEKEIFEGITTAIFLDTRRKTKGDKYPAKLRVTFQRESRFYSINVRLTQNDFDKTVGTSETNRINRGKYKDWNFDFTDAETRAREILKQMSFFSFDEFKKRFESKRKVNIECVLTRIIDLKESLSEQGRIETASVYSNLHKALSEFQDGKKLTFVQITPDYLQRFDTWMQNNGKSQTTVGIYMRHLRRIINIAIEEKIISQSVYPFGSGSKLYTIPKPRNIKKALPISDIKKLFKYKPAPKSPERYYIDLWLFSYFCNGINVKDICHLKYENIKDDQIFFHRAKTRRSDQTPIPISVALIPQIKTIINRWGTGENYIFPILKDGMSAEDAQKRVKTITKSINKYIKVIAIKVGITQNVSTYTARHSFATVLKRANVSVEFISEALGHKNLSTTESYLGSFEKEERIKNAKNLIPK